MPQSPTLAVHVDGWLRRHAASVAPRTIWLYRFNLTHYVLPTLGDVVLDDLTKAAIHACLGALLARGLSTGTWKMTKIALAACLEDAVQAGLLEKNPARGLRVRHRRVRDRGVYDASQLELFCVTSTQIRPDIAPLFHCCAKAGLRIGEAIALRAEDVDVAGRQLSIVRSAGQLGTVGPPKGGKSRRVAIPASLATTLAPRLAAGGYLFPGRLGVRRYATVLKAMARIVRVARLPPLSPHGLRRSHASALVSEGVSVEFVRRQLGHSSMDMTIREYGRFLPIDPPAKFARS